MKRRVLYTLIVIALFFGGRISAQMVPSNFSNVNTAPDTVNPIEFYITIQNQGADTLYAMVSRTLVNVLPAHEESFCFGPNCYPPNTPVSSDPAIIPPGAYDNTFKTDMFSHGVCGTSYVRYHFFNQNNPIDTLNIDLSYGFCTAVGVNELSESFGVSRPSINPANTYTSFNYHLSDNSGKASIVVYNMLGSLVKTVPIPQKNGVVIMTTSELQPGVYLCSVINSGTVTKTYKLVVEHK